MKEEILKVTIEGYDKTFSFEMGDSNTWLVALDSYIQLLNCIGFRITDTEQLQKWLDNTEVVSD